MGKKGLNQRFREVSEGKGSVLDPGFDTSKEDARDDLAGVEGSTAGAEPLVEGDGPGSAGGFTALQEVGLVLKWLKAGGTAVAVRWQVLVDLLPSG